SNIKTSVSFMSKIPGNIDILIVDDKTIPYSQYTQNFSKFLKQIKSNYYIASDIDTYSTVNKTLSSYGIIVIPPLLTDTQISQKICSLAVENFTTGKNTICFFGSGPGVGTSMISQSVAQVFSDITGKSTVFLTLNGSYGIDYFDIDLNNCGLAEIKERLINNILSPEELKNSCIKSDFLYVLAGEGNIAKLRYYHPDHIEKLVELSSKTFEVTIINGGSNITGMSIGALNSAKIKYLITTQSDNHFRNFKKLVNQIFINLGISEKDFSLIVNKYIDSSELETEISLAKNYGMPLASVIPLLDYTTSLEAEKKKKTLIGYDRAYDNSIRQLAVSLCRELGIEAAKKGKGKGSFFKRIMGKIQ
ncbi:unnamed protein product, partial [marine sediment metagenome]